MKYHEPCWAILSDLGGHLGLSEALLEPSWAILDALPTRGAPRPGPGEGVRGRGKTIPEGEEGRRGFGRNSQEWLFYRMAWWGFAKREQFQQSGKQKGENEEGEEGVSK